MRLIDADALLQKVGEIRATEDLYNFAHEIYNAIKSQPTAYDTEKVVAELEQEKNAQARFEKKAKNNIQKNFHTYASTCLEYAIDIVKRGGVE